MDHGPAGGARELPLFGPRATGPGRPGRKHTLSHKSEVLNAKHVRWVPNESRHLSDHSVAIRPATPR
jgi:hypothetical protein